MVANACLNMETGGTILEIERLEGCSASGQWLVSITKGMEFLFPRSRLHSIPHKACYVFSSLLREVSWGLIIFPLWLTVIFVPEDSGREYNPGETPSKRSIVNSAHGEALMDPAAATWHFGSEMEKEVKACEPQGSCANTLNKFSPQIAF